MVAFYALPRKPAVAKGNHYETGASDNDMPLRQGTEPHMALFKPENNLSWRVTGVKEAAILRMSRKAREMRAQGHDIIALTIGEPDFDTPRHIRDAAARALEEGWTHYAPIPGLPELRAAIAAKLKHENGLDYSPDEIVVSNGAKQAITNAIFSLVEDGDEVILPAPYWVAYEGVIRLAGGRPVPLPSSFGNSWRVSAAQIATAMSERTKLVLINTPSNPSGMVWPLTALKALANIVRGHPSCMVLSDEIYEYIVFDGHEHHSIAALPGMKQRTVTVNGFSKGFAMTGWRLGYAAAAEPVARAMQKMQGALTAGANAFVQRAAISALEGPRQPVEEMRRAYEKRRALVVERLSAMAGVRVLPPQGTFYAFPDVSRALAAAAEKGIADSTEELCDWLLQKHHVALVPGSAFGAGGAVRISFATSLGELEKGLERLAVGLREIMK